MSSHSTINRSMIFYEIDHESRVDGLYQMIEVNSGSYVACCINHDCISFYNADNYEEICSKSEIIIFFKDSIDEYLNDSNAWYMATNSNSFGLVASQDPTVRHGIAVNNFFATDYDEIYKNVAAKKWKFAFALPHIVYGHNHQNKYKIFRDSLERDTNSSPLSKWLDIVGIAQLMLPLGIRYSVEVFFLANRDLKATEFEIEQIARLEMRLQQGYTGGIIGTALNTNIDARAFKNARSSINNKELQDFLMKGLLKSTGKITKIEEIYLEFYYQCREIDFNLLSAIHMYFFGFENTRGTTRDLHSCNHGLSGNINSSKSIPELSEVCERYEYLLKIVRQN